MKGLVRVFNGAVLCVLLASAPVAEQAAPTATDRITVPFSEPERPGTLRVSLLDGSVTIKGSNRRDVSFVADSAGAREALRRRRQTEPASRSATTRCPYRPGSIVR